MASFQWPFNQGNKFRSSSKRNYSCSTERSGFKFSIERCSSGLIIKVIHLFAWFVPLTPKGEHALYRTESSTFLLGLFITRFNKEVDYFSDMITLDKKFTFL